MWFVALRMEVYWCCCVVLSGFTPDFELPEYTIPEENGPVVVCIIIPQGQLERNAVATFVTMDRSARGKGFVY